MMTKLNEFISRFISSTASFLDSILDRLSHLLDKKHEVNSLYEFVIDGHNANTPPRVRRTLYQSDYLNCIQGRPLPQSILRIGDGYWAHLRKNQGITRNFIDKERGLVEYVHMYGGKYCPAYMSYLDYIDRKVKYNYMLLKAIYRIRLPGETGEMGKFDLPYWLYYNSLAEIRCAQLAYKRVPSVYLSTWHDLNLDFQRLIIQQMYGYLSGKHPWRWHKLGEVRRARFLRLFFKRADGEWAMSPPIAHGPFTGKDDWILEAGLTDTRCFILEQIDIIKNGHILNAVNRVKLSNKITALDSILANTADGGRYVQFDIWYPYPISLNKEAMHAIHRLLFIRFRKPKNHSEIYESFGEWGCVPGKLRYEKLSEIGAEFGWHGVGMDLHRDAGDRIYYQGGQLSERLVSAEDEWNKYRVGADYSLETEHFLKAVPRNLRQIFYKMSYIRPEPPEYMQDPFVRLSTAEIPLRIEINFDPDSIQKSAWIESANLSSELEYRIAECRSTHENFSEVLSSIRPESSELINQSEISFLGQHGVSVAEWIRVFRRAYSSFCKFWPEAGPSPDDWYLTVQHLSSIYEHFAF